MCVQVSACTLRPVTCGQPDKGTGRLSHKQIGPVFEIKQKNTSAIEVNHHLSLIQRDQVKRETVKRAKSITGAQDKTLYYCLYDVEARVQKKVLEEEESKKKRELI